MKINKEKKRNKEKKERREKSVYQRCTPQIRVGSERDVRIYHAAYDQVCFPLSFHLNAIYLTGEKKNGKKMIKK